MHVKDLLSLKGKVVFVTGGAGKFGKCIAEGAAEADGTVVIASRNLENCKKLAAKFRERDFDVHALQVDQGDHQSVMALKKDIKQKFGGLDVFVNNAYLLPMLHYEDPLEKYAESMKVNATGMFDIVREMADLIAIRGGGSIINIGSMKGSFSPDFPLYEGTDMDSPPDYNFHKGGMIGLTHYLALKLAPKGIRVNCISPGGLFANQPEPFRSKYNEKVPLGRMANDDDIKGLIVLLASDASAYLTGENILMDGGLHA